MIKLKNLSKVLINFYLILLQVSVILSKGQRRIVGGHSTTIESAPFLVQLHKDGKFNCGGSIVGLRTVITAAHCVENVDPGRLMVVAGATKLTDNGVRVKVSKVMVPAAYNNTNYNFDAAVLKLASSLQGPLIKPIALCSQKWNPGDVVQLFGWGKRHEDANSVPNELQTATVNAISKEACADMYRGRMDVMYTMFCTYKLGQDACSGDSGGPAIINNQLCGVVSWGIGCGRTDGAGVFSDMNKMHNIISKYVED